MKDLSYRCSVKNKLAKHLSCDNPWRQLLLGADDDEMAHTYSSSDRMNGILTRLVTCTGL
jgi:hypothetical protein